MTKRGLVLGCGGTVGGAWMIGALHSVQHALGWDPREADVIVGTSAGATTAAMLAAGVGTEEMLAGQRGEAGARESVRTFFTQPPLPRPRVPFGRVGSLRMVLDGTRSRRPLTALAGLAPAGRTDPSFLNELVDDLVPEGCWSEHPATWLVAADQSSGRRVAFGAPGAPRASLRDAARASWAIPSWYPPVTIDGTRYIDGGTISPTSADLVIDRGVEEVVVVGPMASVGVSGVGVERLIRRPMSRIVDAEVVALRDAGVRVVRVHPGADELEVMGWNFMDPARRLPALEAALAHLPARLAAEVGN